MGTRCLALVKGPRRAEPCRPHGNAFDHRAAGRGGHFFDTSASSLRISGKTNTPPLNEVSSRKGNPRCPAVNGKKGEERLAGSRGPTMSNPTLWKKNGHLANRKNSTINQFADSGVGLKSRQ